MKPFLPIRRVFYQGYLRQQLDQRTLAAFQRNNMQQGITGILHIYKSQMRVKQVIEGEKDVIDKLWKKLQADQRMQISRVHISHTANREYGEYDFEIVQDFENLPDD